MPCRYPVPVGGLLLLSALRARTVRGYRPTGTG